MSALLKLAIFLVGINQWLLLVNAVDVVVGQSCAGLQHGTKFTNPENCRTYIVCYNGLFQVHFCPSGFYNPIKDDCDLDYKCILDNLPEGTTELDEIATSTPALVTTTTTTESPTTIEEETTTMSPATEAVTVTDTPIPTTTTTDITTEGSPDQYSCPSEDTEEPTYLNDKKDCEKYYLCYHSRPIEMRCIMGMYWNSETLMCDYPQNVKCPGANSDASPLPKCTSEGRYSMPHPNQCEFFIMCLDGEQTIQQCEAFHHWDLVTQKCVIKDRATCVLDVART